jgi:hypothetical protein
MEENKVKELLYQIRIDFEETLADDIRKKKVIEILPALDIVLKENSAVLVCQFDAFNSFLKECEGEGNTNNPLYRWTKDTIQNENKKKKYLKSFTVYIEQSQLYEKAKADKVESEIKLLNIKKILKINKYNSDPKNNPQPPKKYL